MIALIPGNYSHVPTWLWILFVIAVGVVAVCGAYLVIRGIFQGEETERWIDQEDTEPDIWEGFHPAEQSYERHPVPDAKPLSVVDWVFRQQ